MNDEQIKLIKRSFKKISSEAFAESFYNNLFSIQPALRLLFPDDFEEQKKKLMLMLEATIEMLDEPEKLIPVLEESGRRHALYGAREEHYETVGAALLASLRETLGKEFTDETEAAWTKLYKEMSEIMKRGARQLSGASEQNQSQINRRTEMKNYIRYCSASIFAMLLTAATITAAPVVRRANGANAAAIQGMINVFRTIDLGGVNNGVGGSFVSGRREINWDDVPDNFSPFNLPANYFNSNSPRGAVLSTPCNNAGNGIMVSARQGNPAGTPVRFGNVNSTYPATFTTYSGERLVSASPTGNKCNILTVNFFIPGTNIPATVSGFGVVFTDVDSFNSRIICYDEAGNVLPSGVVTADIQNGGLSFIGVSYNNGERIARVDVVSGNYPLAPAYEDGEVEGLSIVDVVAMDDFIYGEPRASQFHSGDFDGDGTADTAIFRPSTGDWFIQQSGSLTVRIDHFGANGDIPINGDFDGDKLADVAIYRPSNGQWWFKRSTNGTNFSATFGAPGDKPVPGDYDKDGKTDFAFFRPGTNEWFVLRSRDSFTTFYSYPFGANGDIPLGSTIYP